MEKCNACRWESGRDPRLRPHTSYLRHDCMSLYLSYFDYSIGENGSSVKPMGKVRFGVGIFVTPIWGTNEVCPCPWESHEK